MVRSKRGADRHQELLVGLLPAGYLRCLLHLAHTLPHAVPVLLLWANGRKADSGEDSSAI